VRVSYIPRFFTSESLTCICCCCSLSFSMIRPSKPSIRPSRARP
jgi:hypothetical protein